MKLRSGIAHILETPTYKPGDPEPTGYLQWHAWAEVQHAAGLIAMECPRCARFNYPQSMSEQRVTIELIADNGSVVTEQAPICKACEESEAIACEITR